jgi:alpha-ketoglutarate-dependent taurine dioxygenase
VHPFLPARADAPEVIVFEKSEAVAGYENAWHADVTWRLEPSLGSVLRAVDGPLAEVRGLRPHETEYAGVAQHLPSVWVAVRASLRRVLDETTLAQVLSGSLPAHVRRLNEAPDAWLPR